MTSSQPNLHCKINQRNDHTEGGDDLRNVREIVQMHRFEALDRISEISASPPRERRDLDRLCLIFTRPNLNRG